MSEKAQLNKNMNNSHQEMNIEPHSNYYELFENRKCRLIDEIYPPSQNENLEDVDKNCANEENKIEFEQRKSTSFDSMISEGKNPKPIKINIKDSSKENDKDIPKNPKPLENNIKDFSKENDQDISKNPFETHNFLSDDEEKPFEDYLNKIKEPDLKSPDQSEKSDNEESIKIELGNNKSNYSFKPKLIGKKTKRKWKLQAINETSKKNKLNAFLQTNLELDLACLLNNKRNNNEEDEDGDRLDIWENNFSEICCNRKFYWRGYSPHIIELSESLTRNHASFRNDWQMLSTNFNSFEASGN